MIRYILLYLNYLIQKIRDLGKIKYNGFTILYAFKGSSIKLGKGVVINSSPLSNLLGLYQRCIMVARYGGRIIIGERTGISGSTIYSIQRISIGRNCIIGANCKIIDNDFHPLQASKRLPQKLEDIKKKPIDIGNSCFIGANSIILKGTTLGENCVVGAGSVVSGKFGDNLIIAGNPAVFIADNK